MKRVQGFTLIELIAAMAVIAILAAIAIPNYRAYVQRANRSAAQQFMMQIASYQESYLGEYRAYTSTISNLNLGVPSDVSVNYTFSLSSVTSSPPFYKVVATPKSTGANADQSTLYLSSRGEKSPSDQW